MTDRFVIVVLLAALMLLAAAVGCGERPTHHFKVVGQYVGQPDCLIVEHVIKGQPSESGIFCKVPLQR